MKKYPCIEFTLDTKVRNKEIRLWVNETHPGEIKEDLGIISDVQSVFKNYDFSNEWMVEQVRKIIPNLNAIQIRQLVETPIGSALVGEVFYLVDFNDNVHG